MFIDDATGRLTSRRFAPVESGAAYLAALRDHVLAHGCPPAFYSDWHGIFRVNAKDAESGDGKIEFGRVVERLEIGLIHALTLQAKGAGGARQSDAAGSPGEGDAAAQHLLDGCGAGLLAGLYY